MPAFPSLWNIWDPIEQQQQQMEVKVSTTMFARTTLQRIAPDIGPHVGPVSCWNKRADTSQNNPLLAAWLALYGCAWACAVIN